MPSFQSPRGVVGSGRGRKAPPVRVRSSIVWMTVPVIALYILIVYRFAHQHRDTAAAHYHHAMSSPMMPPLRKIDYVMWSKDEAYMRDCELHYKHNETWGKMHAPPVDKIEAKRIVEGMGAPGLRIIPTLAVLDRNNVTEAYTLEFMKQLKQPYIIKSTHVSGGVARVYDNKYHCFKYCINQTLVPLGPEAHKRSKIQLMEDLHFDYSQNGGELQYKYITPRVIIEEDIISSGKTDTDVTFWWLSNGVPVFVSQQCPGNARKGFQLDRVFVGTDYRRLPIVFNRGTCEALPPKPQSWERQREVVRALGKAFPDEVVRIDVYAGGDAVWFSEFTFTSAGCWRRFTPAVADGLLYGLMKGKIPPGAVTPASVEEMLTDDSWVSVVLDDEGASAAYPSPVDLCLTFEGFAARPRMKQRLFDSCIQSLRSKVVRKFPLRCIVSDRNGTRLHAFGLTVPSGSRSNVERCAEKCSSLSGKCHNL